jgi:hypothetical protein
MNDPHTQGMAKGLPDGVSADDLFEVSGDFLNFCQRAHELWENNADDQATAESIRQLALGILSGDDKNDGSHVDGPAAKAAMVTGKIPHTMGREDHRLESEYRRDAAGLMSHGTTDDLSDLIARIKPRKMSRQELQRAADKLVGISVRERKELDALESHRAQRQGTRPTLTRKQLADDAKKLLGGH